MSETPTRPLWREIAPQVNGSILRADGRICVLHSAKPKVYADRRKRIILPIPQIVFTLFCRETLPAKQVSLVTYFPAQVTDAPTCLACIAAREEQPHGKTVQSARAPHER
jgi:hypothetical protein